MLASLLLMAAMAAPRTDSRVQPLTGPAVEGELLDLSAAELRLRTVDGERTFSLRDLLHVAVQGGAKPSDSSPTVWVTLVDGSLLLANGYESAGGKAVVRLLGHGAAEVSTSAIRCVRWASQDEILAKQWREIAASEAAGDLIVVRRTPAALDQWEGVLHDIGEEAVQFELDGQRVSIPRVKLEGVLYYQSAGRELGEPVCRVSDLFGSQWSVQSLASAKRPGAVDDDGRRQLPTAGSAGGEIRFRRGQCGLLERSGAVELDVGAVFPRVCDRVQVGHAVPAAARPEF